MPNALILLLLAAGTPLQPRCHTAAQQATGHLQAADRALARRDTAGANVALDRALAALGDRYAPPGTIDDTGMHLVLANRQRSATRGAQAKRRILIERLALCRQPATPAPLAR